MAAATSVGSKNDPSTR
nr:unnamed protein product [Callosobruchus analis]